jgi:hypothetical protein
MCARAAPTAKILRVNLPPGLSLRGRAYGPRSPPGLALAWHEAEPRRRGPRTKVRLPYQPRHCCLTATFSQAPRSRTPSPRCCASRLSSPPPSAPMACPPPRARSSCAGVPRSRPLRSSRKPRPRPATLQAPRVPRRRSHYPFGKISSILLDGAAARHPVRHLRPAYLAAGMIVPRRGGPAGARSSGSGARITRF